MVYEILVPPPVIKHRALALEARSLNHRTDREVPKRLSFKHYVFLLPDHVTEISKQITL